MASMYVGILIAVKLHIIANYHIAMQTIASYKHLHVLYLGQYDPYAYIMYRYSCFSYQLAIAS